MVVQVMPMILDLLQYGFVMIVLVVVLVRSVVVLSRDLDTKQRKGFRSTV